MIEISPHLNYDATLAPTLCRVVYPQRQWCKKTPLQPTYPHKHKIRSKSSTHKFLALTRLKCRKNASHDMQDAGIITDW